MRFNTLQRLAVLAAVAGISLLATSSAVAQVPGSNGRIAIDNVDTGTISTISWDTPEKLVPFAGPCCSRPNYSPDGRTIAFVASDEIFTQNVDGTNLQRLTNNGEADDEPVFSPDGTTIAYSRKPSNGLRSIWQMNADGSNQTQLTHPTDPNNMPFIADSSPSYSPDGKTIAYTSTGTKGSSSHVYTMTAEGTNQKQLEVGLLQSGKPSYSPDGKRIVFLGQTPTDAWSVYTMRADGSGSTSMTTSASLEGSPTYSPDGKYIAFVRGEQSAFIIDSTNGENERELQGTKSGNPRNLAWQPLSRPPACDDLTLYAASGKPVQGAANCTDPDGDRFTFALASKPSHGTATSDANGKIQYQPNAEFAGTERFTLAVTDARGAKATVQVTVQVAGPEKKADPVTGPGNGGVIVNKNPTPAAKLSAIGKASKSKKGKFTVKLTCSPGAGTCGGKLVIKSAGKKPKTVASASYSLAPGSSKSIKLKLNKTGRKLQRKGHKKLKAKATAATLKTTFTIKGN